MVVETRERRSVGVGLLCAVLLGALAGCADTAENQPKTAYYRCADTARFGVTPMKKDKIELSRSPNRYTLSRVEAASGVKYASSKASFWNQGEEALVTVGDKSYSGCRLDNVQSDPESISTLQRFLMQGGTGGGGQR
jgi:membrane-bound inhibitor of C-type lysozyme